MSSWRRCQQQVARDATARRTQRGARRPFFLHIPAYMGQLHGPVTWASYMGQLHGPASAQAGLWLATSPQPNPQEAHAWGCTGVLLASARLAALVGAKERGVAATALREIQGWVAQSGWRQPARLFPLPQRPDK